MNHCQASPGKFRVVLVDNERRGSWPGEEYDTEIAAGSAARELNDTRNPDGSYYVVYNDRGIAVLDERPLDDYAKRHLFD